MKHIAVLTGKRGGYGAMKPMLRLLEDADDMKLSLIVTDQHVDPRFGNTIKEVQKDFTVAAAVPMEQADGSGAGRSAALGLCLNRMPEALEKLNPDAIVLYGDRGEVLVTGIAALNLGIPIAHLQGGDVSGNVDEQFRHALTKLAHLHFPSTQESAARIKGLGEEDWRITVAGDNHIDQIVAGVYTPADALRKKFDIPEGEAPILVLQHSETTRKRDNYADMTGTLDAVLALGRRTIVVYPCSDQGYEDVVRAIEDKRGAPNLSIYQNIEAPDFWGLMAIAGAFIGNSSAGLIETPTFRLPSLTLGERQIGRQRAENTITTEFGQASVAAALDKVLNDPDTKAMIANCSQPFGDGKAGERVVETLRNTDLSDPKLINKRMTF